MAKKKLDIYSFGESISKRRIIGTKNDLNELVEDAIVFVPAALKMIERLQKVCWEAAVKYHQQMGDKAIGEISALLEFGARGAPEEEESHESPVQ